MSKAPAFPVTFISRTAPLLNASELWRFREVLFHLVLRDIKIRYKQTAFGVAWALLQPASTMFVFWVCFGKVAAMAPGGIPYPIFSYVGVTVWLFFSKAVLGATASLVNNAELMHRIYLPRILIPASNIIANMVDFILGALFAIPVSLACGVTPSLGILLVWPFLLLMTGLFALGVSLLLGTFHMRFRDVGYALTFGIQLWMYATPVIYPVTFLPTRLQWVISLNPLSGLLAAFRASLHGVAVDVGGFSIAVASSLAVFASGVLLFSRLESRFADHV